MNLGEWQAKLYDRPGMTNIELWLTRRTNDGYEILTHDGITKKIKEGTPTNPGDYFVLFESYDQLRSIADAFADYGVKDKNDFKNEGLLEAKDAHLQDMRRLVFEASPPQTKETE